MSKSKASEVVDQVIEAGKTLWDALDHAEQIGEMLKLDDDESEEENGNEEDGEEDNQEEDEEESEQR